MLSDPREHRIYFTSEDLFKQGVFQITAGKPDVKDVPTI